jgi:hypothetical protein
LSFSFHFSFSLSLCHPSQPFSHYHSKFLGFKTFIPDLQSINWRYIINKWRKYYILWHRNWFSYHRKRNLAALLATCFHGGYSSTWRWRRYVPPKRLLTFKELHSVVRQETVFYTSYCSLQGYRISYMCTNVTYWILLQG